VEQLKEDVILVRHPKHEELYFLLLNKKANTFTSDFVRLIHSKLDIVEETPGKIALVTSSLHPNIFSAGLDLNFIAVHFFFNW
jgi:enoyl-CoA hydratase/carnithine racemase